MTLVKLKLLSAVAATAVLVGGTAGTFALNAQEKVKPAATPAKPGEKPAKPADGEKPKPAPDGEKGKEAKKPGRVGGTVSAVDAKAGTVTLTRGGDGPKKSEQVVKMAADAKVVVDGKAAKLDDVPKGAQVEVIIPEGSTDAAGLMASGPRVVGVVTKVEGSSLTLEMKGNEATTTATYTVPKDLVVGIDGKQGTAADLKPGLRVGVQVAVDGKTVLAVKGGAEGGEKGAKGQRYGGRVSGVDAAAGTLTLTTKGEGGGKEVVVKLAADAKVLVDGQEVKLAAVPKSDSAFAEVMLAAGGKDAVEVRVTGMRFVGNVKSVDGSSITLGGEKADRVLKLATGGKVAVNGKPATLADIKPGDKVSVQMAADDSGALVIMVGGGEKGAPDKPKKPGGDKE